MFIYENLYIFGLILIVLIIIINIIGGSINFFESLNIIQNNMKPTNIEAFISENQIYDIINNISKTNNNDKKNFNSKLNSNINLNKNILNTEENIQSNLINVSNKTENDFYSLI